MKTPVTVRAIVPFLAALMLLQVVSPGRAADVPMIDAHSQVDSDVTMETVLSVLDQAGISHVILSSLHGNQKVREIVATAKGHSARITPSIGLKSSRFREGEAKAVGRIRRMGTRPAFGALSEAMVLHQQKGRRAPEIVTRLDGLQVRTALAIAQQRGWPLVLHIEFGFARATGRYQSYMEDLERFAAAHRDLAVALTHMGQLGPDEVGKLIESHPNIYFLTSHANSVWIADRGTDLPWSNLFDGNVLASAWKTLIVSHPDRFILAFDNVYNDDWSDHYVRQAKLWKAALRSLPDDVAHAVAHGNAERLWHLPETIPVSAASSR